MTAGALGDALGARFEGLPWRWPTTLVRPGRSLQCWRAPHHWTDDTDMTLATLLAAESFADTQAGPISAGDSHFERLLLERFLTWRRRGVRADMGVSTIRVLGALDEPDPARAREAARRVDSAGNGAMMRAPVCAVLAPCSDAAAFDLAASTAELTHGTAVAAQAAGAVAALCRHGSAEGRLEPAAVLDLGRPLDPLIERALRRPERPRLSRAKAWAPATLSGVLWTTGAVMERFPASRWLDDGLRFAVAQGGDTDTVAALVGALLGTLADPVTPLPRWAPLVHGGDWTGARWTAPQLAELTHRVANRPTG